MITAEEVLKEKNREMVCIPSDRTILEALRLMNKQNIGAILVKQEGKIVGIWTERDLLHNMNLPVIRKPTYEKFGKKDLWQNPCGELY